MLSLNFEQLSESELFRYFKNSEDTFSSLRNNDFAVEYSQKLASNANFIIGRNENGEIGCMIAYYGNRKPYLFFSHVHTLIEYRGQGYFKKMLELILTRHLSEGFNIIQLEVRKDNDIAIKVYLNSGFIISGEKLEKYVMTLK